MCAPSGVVNGLWEDRLEAHYGRAKRGLIDGCWPVELVDLADLLVEHGRGRVAAQLADAAREWPGRVAELRVRAGGRRDDGVGHDRWFVAAPDCFDEQGVEHFAASRIDGKGLIGGDGVRVERGPRVGGLD